MVSRSESRGKVLLYHLHSTDALAVVTPITGTALIDFSNGESVVRTNRLLTYCTALEATDNEIRRH